MLHQVKQDDEFVEQKSIAASVNEKRRGRPAKAKKNVAKANNIATNDWIVEEFVNVPESIFPSQDYSKYRDMTPVKLFELFFNDEVFQITG